MYSPPRIHILPNSQTKIYTIGDIHGCYLTFKHLLEKQLIPTKDDWIILLGDLINKGKDSRKLLDYLIELENSGYQLICLKGNHEKKLLMAFGAGIDFFEEFLTQYNSLDLLDGDVLKYLDFCDRMEYYAEYENFLLSHIGFNDSIPTPTTDTRSLFPEAKLNVSIKGKRQVFGHHTQSLAEIEKSIREKSMLIGIDNGCIYSPKSSLGNLCSFELTIQKLYIQPNIER